VFARNVIIVVFFKDWVQRSVESALRSHLVTSSSVRAKVTKSCKCWALQLVIILLWASSQGLEDYHSVPTGWTPQQQQQ
jgi:hypothetical protein